MWILPTYKRPDRLAETVASLIKCNVGERGVIVIDDKRDTYPEDVVLPKGWRLMSQGWNQGYIKIIQRVLEEYPDEPWYGWVTDDMIAETVNFESRLLAYLSHKCLFASSNDDWQAPKRMHGAAVFNGEFYRTLFAHFPVIRHSYYDDILENIGRDFGCWTVDMNIMVRHNHPANDKKVKLDQTYETAYSHMQQDHRAYEDWKWTKKVKLYRILEDRFGVKSKWLPHRKVPLL